MCKEFAATFQQTKLQIGLRNHRAGTTHAPSNGGCVAVLGLLFSWLTGIQVFPLGEICLYVIMKSLQRQGKRLFSRILS